VIDGSGVYGRLLQSEAVRRGLGDLPFASLPEAPDAGSFEEALAAIERMLGGTA
jgi:hypothetical protein